MKQPRLFYISVIAAGLLTITSCGMLHNSAKLPGRLEVPEYLSWYESARYPLRDTVKLEDIVYICTLVPKEVEIARQLHNGLIAEEEAELLLKEESAAMQFQIQIILPQAGTDVLHYRLKENEDVSSRASYFSFGIKKDLSLQHRNSESTDCSALHFEKGISNFPVSRIIAFFPYRNEAIRSVTMLARAFSDSSITFDFNDLTITDLPKLIL